MKKQIGVIFGSRSCEREVSIISAVQLMRSADTDKYDIIPVYIDESGTWYTGDSLKDIRSYKPFNPSAKGIRKVFPDLTGGSGALLYLNKGTGLFAKERLEIAARVELAKIPYTSTGVAGSAIGMDRIMRKQFFTGAELPVLPGEWFTRREFASDWKEILNTVSNKLGFPVFVKPANLGSSIGVSRADNAEELKESLSLAFEYDRRVLVEKGLDKPVELNCSVLGYDDEVIASPIEMPLNHDEFLDFRDKYLGGGGSKGMASLSRVLPAPIEDSLKKEIQDLSIKIFRLLDCKGVVRIDYMFDRITEKLFITEINTIPGSLAFYLWEKDGIPYKKLIDRMISCAEKAFEDRNLTNYAYTSDILKNASFGTKGAKGTKNAGPVKG